jgi:hypothetical protein
MLSTPIKIMVEKEDHPRKITLKVTVGKDRTIMTTSMSLKMRTAVRSALKYLLH